MDEEQEIRVTRLRRRLSVEKTDDVSSPAGTPTKKRVTKLPKPALDNIAENAVVDSPRRTTRRSIALDTTADEVATPGKKTRGKANTSLLSDSIQGAESPRATRTTRRNSLVGNESETTVITPVRRSRRISKDSPETVVELKVPAKKSRRLSAASQDVIVEENEKDDANLISFSPENAEFSTSTKEEIYKCQQEELIKDETNAFEKTSPTSVRKSPRLSLKKNTGIEADKTIEETSKSPASTEIKSSSKKSKQTSGSDFKNKSSNSENCSISELIHSERKSSKMRSKSFSLLEQDFKNDSRIYHSDSECKTLKSDKTAYIVQQESKEVSPSKLEEDKENVNKTHKKYDIYRNKPSNNISGIEILDKTKCQLTDDSVYGKNEEQIQPKNKLNSSITSNIIMEDFDYKDEEKESLKVTSIFYAPKKTESENDGCEPMDVDEALPEKSVTVPNDKPLFEETKLEDITSLGSGKNELQGKINVPSPKNNSATIKSVLTESIKDIDSSKVVTSPKTNSIVSESLETSITKGPIDNIQIKASSKLGPYTSTPVTSDKQPGQKRTSKLSRQETVNSVVEEDSSEEDTTDEEREKQETLVDNEAEDAGKDYESGDSQNESEREYDCQNQIPVKGETLDSQEDEESDESDYEKDSFVVSSDAEDEELLSGSGDDLALSDNELKMCKNTKEKYNKRREKEQKSASREMFEARHGISKDNSNLKEWDDDDIIFTSKNKKRNRLRLDSSKDTSNTNVCDEQEMTIIAETSPSDKDPLINDLPIKREVLSANNTVLEEIENVELDQDVTVFANKEDSNPLQSFTVNTESHSESSDDGGIADNYDSLLKDLNSSKDNVKNSDQSKIELNNSDCTAGPHKKVLSMASSYSEYKAPKNKKGNSLLDKLNVTSSRLDHSDNIQSCLKSKEGSSSPAQNLENKKVVSKMNSFLLTSLNTSMNRNRSINETNDSLNTSKKSKKENYSLIEDIHNESSILSKIDSETKNLNTSKTSKKKIKSFISEFGQKENIISEKNCNNVEKNKVVSKMNSFLLTSLNTSMKGDGSISKTNDSLNTSKKSKKENESVVEDIHQENIIPSKIDSETENLNTSKTSKKKMKSLISESGQMENTILEKNFDKSYISINNKSFEMGNSLKIIEKTKNNKSLSKVESREKSVDEHGANDNLTSLTSLNSSKTQNVDQFYNDLNASKIRKKKNISLSDVHTSNEFKEDSIINKLNLTSSGKERKTKSSNAEKERMSANEDSSDEIDFKLLFTQDESSNESYPRRETKTTHTKTVLTEEKDVSSKMGSSLKTKTKKGEHISEELNLNDSNHDDGKNAQKIKKNHKESEHKKAKDMPPDKPIQDQAQQKSRKRKRKEVIPVDNNNKVYLTNDDNKVKVKKLPQGILEKLADRIEIFPTENPTDKKAKAKEKSAISTSDFEVQTVIPKKSKPSQYLEDSIHIDRSPKRQDVIKRVKRPKVLPSVPKASTSTVGFTSNFRVNILKEDVRHDAVLAGPDHIPNFKAQRLAKVKRIATEDLCRTNKSIRMKF